MKKLLVIVVSIILVASVSFAQKRTPPPSKEIIATSSCAWLTFYGALCQDIDDGKLYKWNGVTQVELAAGAGGDMTAAAFDADANSMIDAAAGGTNIDTSALTGTPYVTAGTWSVKSAADEMTALGFSANIQSFLGAADYAAANELLGLGLTDSPTFAGATLTGANSLTLGTQSSTAGSIILHNATNNNHFTIVSGVSGAALTLTLPTAAAGGDNYLLNANAAGAMGYTDPATFAPVANPTFTGVATFPNDGLHILDTNASHDLIITPGSDLSADRILTITTGDAARTLTLTGDATLNQDVSSTANAVFSTLNVVGASALSLGTERTNDGKITFKSGTALNDFVFTITGGNFGADLAWKLPLAVPGGDNYLLNVDADGTMNYTAPVVTNLTAGNWKVWYSNGTGVITELALGGDGTYLRSNGAAAAPTFDTPIGTGDVTGGAASSAGELVVYDGATGKAIKQSGLTAGIPLLDASAVVTSLAHGAQGKILQMGAATPAWSAATFPTAATTGKVLVGNGTNYVESTPTFPNASATARKMIVSDGTDWVASTELWPIATTAGNLLMANGTDWTTTATFTGSYTFGDADADTLTLRSLIQGGNSRGVWIATSAPTPTYATGTNELYVQGDIEVGGIVYAASFESILAPGNVGVLKIKEDPANDVQYRAISVVPALDANLTWVIPNTLPTANSLLTFGAPAADETTLAYTSLASLMDTVLGSTQGSVLYRSGAAWTVLTPGTSGWVLTTKGAAANPEWNAVSAAAGGLDTEIQFNSTGSLAGDTHLTWTAATDTLTSGKFVGDITGTWVPSQAVGDLFQALSATTITRLADVAAGQPLVSGGVATAVGWAGYTFSGTAAQTYTFPSVTASLAPLADPVFTGSVQLPNGANPTTDAAGEVAVDTSAGSGGGLRIYTNATPGAVTIPIYFPGKSTTIKDPTSTSDYAVGIYSYAITLRKVWYWSKGGTWTGQLQICDDADCATATDTLAANVTTADGVTSTSVAFSKSDVAADRWLWLKTASVGAGITQIVVDFEYTVDQVN